MLRSFLIATITLASIAAVSSSALAQPTFRTTLTPVELQYPPEVDGHPTEAVRFSVISRLVVLTGPAIVNGFSFGIRHLPSLFTVLDSFAPRDMQLVHCGLGPDFLQIHIHPDGISGGAVFGFIECGDVPLEVGDGFDMIGVIYETKPGVLDGAPRIDSSLEFTDTLDCALYSHCP